MQVVLFLPLATERQKAAAIIAVRTGEHRRERGEGARRRPALPVVRLLERGVDLEGGATGRGATGMALRVNVQPLRSNTMSRRAAQHLAGRSIDHDITREHQERCSLGRCGAIGGVPTGGITHRMHGYLRVGSTIDELEVHRDR